MGNDPFLVDDTVSDAAQYWPTTGLSGVTPRSSSSISLGLFPRLSLTELGRSNGATLTNSSRDKFPGPFVVETGAMWELEHFGDVVEGLASHQLAETVPTYVDFLPALESGRLLSRPKPRGLQSTR